MSAFFDRVKVGVAAAPNTGAVSLGSAVPGYRTFDGAGVPDGTVVSYVIEDGTSWELGHGTYTKAGASLARTTIFASSSANNAAISASASAVAYLTILAEDIAALASNGGSGGGSGTATTPTVVQVATAAVSGTSPTPITLGSAPTVGNVLIAFMASGDYNVPAGTGWSLLGGRQWTDNESVAVAFKVVTNSDGATVYPFGCSNAGIELYEIGGVNDNDSANGPTLNFPTATSGTQGATVTLPSTPAHTLIVGVGICQQRNIAYTITGALSDASVTGYANNNFTIAGFHKATASAGDVTISTSRSGGADYDWLPVVVFGPKS